MGIRRKNVTEEQRAEVLTRLREGHSAEQVAKGTRLSESTVYKIRREERKAKGLEKETPDVGQEFRVWCGHEEFAYARVVSVEEVSPSGRSVVGFGPLDAEEEVTRVAADALGIKCNVLARLKIEVLDNVAVKLVKQNTESSTSRGLGHEVDAYTPSSGPGSEGAWFWLYGENRELLIRVRNPTKYRTPIGRVRFSGWFAVTKPVNRPGGPVIEAVSKGWT